MEATPWSFSKLLNFQTQPKSTLGLQAFEEPNDIEQSDRHLCNTEEPIGGMAYPLLDKQKLHEIAHTVQF